MVKFYNNSNSDINFILPQIYLYKGDEGDGEREIDDIMLDTNNSIKNTSIPQLKMIYNIPKKTSLLINYNISPNKEGTYYVSINQKLDREKLKICLLKSTIILNR